MPGYGASYHGRGIDAGSGYTVEGPNPKGFDWAGSRDVAFLRSSNKRRPKYAVRVTDRYFGRVICTLDELILPNELVLRGMPNPATMVEIPATAVPMAVYLRLVQIATDAVKEHF